MGLSQANTLFSPSKLQVFIQIEIEIETDNDAHQNKHIL